MNQVKLIADELDACYSGSPWHGPSLKQNLAGVTARQAATRAGETHTIWELVLHLAAWRGEITRRLEGEQAGTPKEGDYPPAPEGDDATQAAWHRALAWLEDEHTRLLAAVRGIRDDDLPVPVLDYRHGSSGEGATRAVTLHGLAQHDAYHSGQIGLLRKMLR